MSAYIKHPYRWARKQLRLIGAACIAEDNDGADIRLPNGATIRITKRVTAAAAIHIVSRARERLGIPGRIPMKGDAPKVDPASVRASVHALERWRLMQSQAALEPYELEDALLRPNRTETSHSRTWIFRTDRIALVLAFDEDGTTNIVTVLWATDDLREAHPRPETRTAPAATGA